MRWDVKTFGSCPVGWCGYNCSVPAVTSQWLADPWTRRTEEYAAVARAYDLTWEPGLCGGTATRPKDPNEYACTIYGASVTDIVVDGESAKQLTFSGTVSRHTKAGQAGCSNNAFSCAGPSVVTRPLAGQAGTIVPIQIEAVTGGEDFEALVVPFVCSLPMASCTAASYRQLPPVLFKRGLNTNGWQTTFVILPQTGTYEFHVHIGSYDYSGGGVVGATLRVRPFALCSA